MTNHEYVQYLMPIVRRMNFNIPAALHNPTLEDAIEFCEKHRLYDNDQVLEIPLDEVFHQIIRCDGWEKAFDIRTIRDANDVSYAEFTMKMDLNELKLLVDMENL